MEIVLLIILGIIAIAEICSAVASFNSKIAAEQIGTLTKQMVNEREDWNKRFSEFMTEIIVLRKWLNEIIYSDENNKDLNFQSEFNKRYNEYFEKKK